MNQGFLWYYTVTQVRLPFPTPRKSQKHVPPYIQAENRETAIPCLQWLQLHLQRKGWVLSSQYWALASGCQVSEDRVLLPPLDHDRFISTPPSLVYFRFNVTALFPPLSGLPLCRVLMSVTHSHLTLTSNLPGSKGVGSRKKQIHLTLAHNTHGYPGDS